MARAAFLVPSRPLALKLPQPQIATRRTANGIEIVSVEMPWLTRLQAKVRVAAGAYEDPQDRDGLAHALEHMVFKGPRGVTPVELARQIEMVGGQMNAYTEQEATTYQVDAPADQLAVAFKTLGDLVLRPALRRADWDSERHVILEEIVMREDDPTTHLFDRGLYELRAGTPWGRLTIGTPDTVRAITIEDLRTFHATHYGAARFQIAVASPWPIDVVEELLEAAGFLDAAPGTPVPTRDAEQMPAGRVHRMRYDSEQLQVALLGAGPSHRDLQIDPTPVIAQLVLDGGMSGRLFQELRERQGLCYAVGLIQDPQPDSGLLGVYGGTSPGKAEQFLASARAEFATLVQAGITQEELDRARMQVRGQILMNGLSPNLHLRQAVIAHSTQLGPATVAERLAQIDAVTVDQVNAGFATWFAPDRLNELQLGPVEGDTSAVGAAT